MPPVVDNAHPFIDFDPVTRTFTNPQTHEERTIITDYIPKLREGGLNYDIINTGDLETLTNFWNDQKDNLTPDERSYMIARINASVEIQNQKIKALGDIAEGKETKGPEPQVFDGNMVGFQNLKSPGVQSSGNGCWSVSYSMLLKSRGVNLSQETIRGWRPDRTKDNSTRQDIQNTMATRNAVTKRMNSDTVNSIPEMGDLLTEVLPNTAMQSITIKPFNHMEIMANGNPLDEQDKETIRNYYYQNVENTTKRMIYDAITLDHSPVSILINGHYKTITAISSDGSEVICEDSMQADPNDRTQRIPMSTIVNDAFKPKIDQNGNEIQPKGLQLAWLHDIKSPEYERRNQEQINLGQMATNAQADQNGQVNIIIPPNAEGISRVGFAPNGQLEGVGFNFQYALNKNELSTLINKNVVSVGPDQGYTIADFEAYYPKQVYFKKDPNLQQYRNVQPVQNPVSGEEDRLKEQTTNVIGEDLHPNDIAYNAMIKQRWEKLNPREGVIAVPENRIRKYLAEIISITELRAKKLKQGYTHPAITDKELQEYSQKVQNDRVFNRMIDRVGGYDIALTKSVSGIKQGLKDALADIKEDNAKISRMNKYDLGKKKDLIQRRCRHLAAKLEETQTGKTYITRKDRSENSDAYEEALQAVKDVGDARDPSAHFVLNKVDTVKAYLRNKMTKRSRTFGQERFEYFMTFLKETMPRKEFEAYCDEINRKRKVQDKPGNENFVSPEQFGYNNEPLSSLFFETRDRLRSGRGTDRDYASLLAMRNLFGNRTRNNGNVFNGNRRLTPDERRQISNLTESYCKSDEFKRFMKEVPLEARKRMLEGTCDAMVNWRRFVPKVEVQNATNNQNTVNNQNTANNQNHRTTTITTTHQPATLGR